MIDPALDQAFGIGMGEGRVRFPTTLDRLIHLRTLPNLGSLAGTGLTYVATHAHERHYEAGELVYRPEEAVTTVHLIVEGGAESSRKDSTSSMQSRHLPWGSSP